MMPAAIGLALFLISISAANAALIGVLPATPNGTDYQAYYDDILDVSWLADANAAGGPMNWSAANSWAANLNVSGVTGWRLPDTNPINGIGFDITATQDGSTDLGHNISAPGTVFAGSTASDLAFLFYNTLGNISDYNADGTWAGGVCGSSCLSDTGPFSNVQAVGYWSAIEFDSSDAWYFHFNVGLQRGFEKTRDDLFYAWAVHDGNISAVPVPAAVWLFGSALGLLGWMRRKAV